MAKGHKAARSFDIGGEEVTHYDQGDSFPASSPHLDQLVADGYVTDGSVDAAAPDSPEEKVRKENQGVVTDPSGTDIDVVGFQTPDAEDVQPEAPKKKPAAKRATSKRTSSK